jgi:hypothetical protein
VAFSPKPDRVAYTDLVPSPSPTGKAGALRAELEHSNEGLLRPRAATKPGSAAAKFECEEPAQRQPASRLANELHAAVGAANLPGVEQLVMAGGDLAEQDSEMGWTALHHAVNIDSAPHSKRRVIMVAALLGMGSSVDADDFYSMTPCAANPTNPRVVIWPQSRVGWRADLTPAPHEGCTWLLRLAAWRAPS